MANSLTAWNPQYWAREMQGIFFKENVAIALANTELRDELPNGTIVHKPYSTYPIDQAYVKGTAISVFNDLTATDDYLTVNTTRVVPFYVDELDRLQNKWDAATVYAQRAQRVLNNRIDQAVIGQYSNSRSYISAQDLGGSGTGSYALSQSNVPNLFAIAARKLEVADVSINSLCAVVGPRTLELLKLYVAGRETGFGDTVGDNGKVAKRFGFDIYQSNNIPWAALITYGASTSNPGNTETFSVDGVVFTFVSSIGSTAGNVLIETAAVDTMTNLCNAINYGNTNNTTAPTKWVDISSSDRKKLLKGNVLATNSTTTFTLAGYGDVALAEGSAGVANFAITTNTQYPLFMVRNAIDLLIQKAPSVEFRMAEKALGRYVYPWVNYGVYTFDQMKDAMTYAKIDVSAWV